MDRNQKVALGVAGLVGAFLVYRHTTSSTSTLAAPASTQGAVAPYIPQQPVTLQSGESIYDPNSGALINTPTASPSAQPAAPQSTTPAAPSYTVNVNYPKPPAVKRTAKKPTKRKVTKR